MAKSEDNYETLYAELEKNIEALQSGELSLDEAVKNYENSKELIKKLEDHIKKAENTITQIKKQLN
jgi:exodeoxyribonuclease VII small subunit